MLKNPYPGKFIVFEGLDGSGQSTQTAFLRDFLIGKGYQVVLTKELTKDSGVGKRIIEILGKKTKIEPKELQELFAKDRKEHLENLIIPALKENKIVISDRYAFSSFAYGVSEGIDLEYLMNINNEFLLPDFTIILKVEPRVCLERIRDRGEERTLFEEEEKLEKVLQTFQTLPNYFENVYIIGGEELVEEVFSKVRALLHDKLNL